MATHISLALVFVEGLVSFLSPCVLPIIPIYMGYLAGNSNEKRNSNKSIIIYNQLYLWDTFSNFSDECVNKFITKFFKRTHDFICSNRRYSYRFIRNLSVRIYQNKFLQRTFRFL